MTKAGLRYLNSPARSQSSFRPKEKRVEFSNKVKARRKVLKLRGGRKGKVKKLSKPVISLDKNAGG